MADNRPEYILWDLSQKKVPPRPADPTAFPRTDPRHWYDYEYAGWHTDKADIPESTGDGARGKHIVLLNGLHPHPYMVDLAAGMSRIAHTYGIEMKVEYAYYNLELQARLVEEAIRESPDLIILVAAHVEQSTGWYRQINAAGIPVLASNTIPEEEGFRYVLAWTGPDDWGRRGCWPACSPSGWGAKAATASPSTCPAPPPTWRAPGGPSPSCRRPPPGCASWSGGRRSWTWKRRAAWRPAGCGATGAG